MVGSQPDVELRMGCADQHATHNPQRTARFTALMMFSSRGTVPHTDCFSLTCPQGTRQTVSDLSSSLSSSLSSCLRPAMVLNAGPPRHVECSLSIEHHSPAVRRTRTPIRISKFVLDQHRHRHDNGRRGRRKRDLDDRERGLQREADNGRRRLHSDVDDRRSRL